MTGNGSLPMINYTTPSGRANGTRTAAGPARDRWDRSVDADRFDAFLRRAQRSSSEDRAASDRPERPGSPADAERRADRVRSPEPGSRRRADEPLSGDEQVRKDEPKRETEQSSKRIDGADRGSATVDRAGGATGVDESMQRAAAAGEGEGGVDPTDQVDPAATDIDEVAEGDGGDSTVKFRPAVEPATVELPTDGEAATVGADGEGGEGGDDRPMSGPTDEGAIAGDETGETIDTPVSASRQSGTELGDDLAKGRGMVDPDRQTATGAAESDQAMASDANAGSPRPETDGTADGTGSDAPIETDESSGRPGATDGPAGPGPQPVPADDGSVDAGLEGGEPSTAGADAGRAAGEADAATDASGVEDRPDPTAVPSEDDLSMTGDPSDAEPAAGVGETAADGNDEPTTGPAADQPQPAAEQRPDSTTTQPADRGSTRVEVASSDPGADTTDARLVDPGVGAAAPRSGRASTATAGESGEVGGDEWTAPSVATTEPGSRTADPGAGSTGGNDRTAEAPAIPAPAPSGVASARAADGPAGAASTIGQLTAAEVADAGLAASALAPTTSGDQTDGADPLWRQIRRALGSLRTTPTGDQQLTIRLRPAELGSVVVRINSGDAGTAVSLVTESSAAANQLNQQRQQLIRDLEDGGLVGVNVDIGSDGGADRTQTGQADADADRTGGQGLFGGSGDPGSIETELARGYGTRRDRGPSVGLIDVDL